jgi:nifR3 family TIM-barrel protein
VHGRTREQQYTGKANWDIIRDVKQAVSIPVIGNGDVFSPEDARRLLEHTGCDGVMIGRGALGNPWMLYRTIQYLSTGELMPDPLPREKMEVAILHMDRLVALKGEATAVREMRKHLAWYLKGLPGAARVKDVIMEETGRDKLVEILDQYISSLDEEELTSIAGGSQTAH